MRFHRAYNQARCILGLHRLKAWAAPDDSGNAYPIDPRGRPGRGDHRRCDWCGKRWVGAYDGIAPFWKEEAA